MNEAMNIDTTEMQMPPNADVPVEHELWSDIETALREIYDPEIPVNIYELGLIYKVEIDKDNNVKVEMTLTAPGCPVAGEMPGWVGEAIDSVEGINDISVDLVWDPPWDPSCMAETARYQLNMF